MSDFLLLYFHNILNQQISTIQWTKTVTLCTMKKVNITTEILSLVDYSCYQIRKCSLKKVKYMSFDFFLVPNLTSYMKDEIIHPFLPQKFKLVLTHKTWSKQHTLTRCHEIVFRTFLLRAFSSEYQIYFIWIFSEKKKITVN